MQNRIKIGLSVLLLALLGASPARALLNTNAISSIPNVGSPAADTLLAIYTNNGAGLFGLGRAYVSNLTAAAVALPAMFKTNTPVDASVNFDQFKTFRDKITAATNVIKLLIVGDSLSQEDPAQCGTARGINTALRSYLGTAGLAGRSATLENGIELVATSTGTATAYANNEGGAIWWGLWHQLTNQNSIDWKDYSLANGRTADTVGIYWIAGPTGGNMDFNVSTNGGAWAKLAVLDGNAVSSVLRKTNFTLARNSYRVQATNNTLLKTNYVLGAEIYDSTTKGLVTWFCGRGGYNFSQMTNYPAGVYTNLANFFGADLLVYSFGDLFDLSENDAMERYWITNICRQVAGGVTNVLMVGPWNRNDSYDYLVPRENAVMRDACITLGWTFNDTYRDAGTPQSIIARGYNQDSAIIHLNALGSDAFGAMAVAKMNLGTSRRLPASAVIPGTITAGYLVGDGTGITRATNEWSINANDVWAAQASTVINQDEAHRIGWPAYNGGTTVGSAAYWVTRSVIGCYLSGAFTYKINCTAPPSATRGKTNVVIVQKFWTTNTAVFSASCAIEYVGIDGQVRWQGGLLVNNQTHALTTNPYLLRVTNAFALHPTCTNGDYSFLLGSGSTLDSGSVVNRTNTIWWGGADLYFY